MSVMCIFQGINLRAFQTIIWEHDDTCRLLLSSYSNPQPNPVHHTAIPSLSTWVSSQFPFKSWLFLPSSLVSGSL